MTTDHELHRRRASSFGGQAAAYAEFRPDYPAAAVRWALAPVADRAGLHVLDLAAGTGKLTAALVAEGVPTTAVEPDAAMRTELQRALPDVPAHEGTAERIPLPAASVDAVLVGQAFHWFDPERALPEIARVLRPGGVVAGLWNGGDREVDWIIGLDEVTRGEACFADLADEVEVPAHERYEPVQRQRFPNRLRYTRDSLTAMVATHSRLLLLPEDERAQLLARVRGYLAARPETQRAEFEVPLVTLVDRAVLRG
ncbi:class I SAM-dependent methyltransferase [Streptomyces sp. CMB-StM0423]|uniref:class I SAM-dependent methyltransferase n=1 Tax=Streptomyces sp. CMB-StM0423 TaxID=2059884 RepID=UPI000C70363C|nr:class I SAM-dependent methyltransferase [Streptomyces sp. CMB-StM0423]AUH43804.1 SAM-dependent methyltransferase [Streptomyces sp. CMB-StM0423]